MFIINCSSVDRGGSVQVGESLLREFSTNARSEPFFAFLSPGLADIAENLDSDIGNVIVHDRRPAQGLSSFLAFSRNSSAIEKASGPRFVLTSSGPAYWRPAAPHVIGYNLPHYIYPESPYFRSIGLKERLKWFAKGQVIRYFFKRDGDAYIVQTDDVKDRLERWLGRGHIYTVPNTCSSVYLNPLSFPSRLPKKKNGVVRLLTVSAYYPHKNLEIIRDVVDAMREAGVGGIEFVLTLPQDIYECMFGESYRDVVTTVGSVPPEECPSLYSECDFMFLPTLLECFSASYPEAMAMKKPILTSDLGFARSICKSAALYFDPMNASDILNEIIRLKDSKRIQQELIQNGLERLKSFPSATERARRYLEICEETRERLNQRLTKPPPRPSDPT